jgi:hypothetical protein
LRGCGSERAERIEKGRIDIKIQIVFKGVFTKYFLVFATEEYASGEENGIGKGN